MSVPKYYWTKPLGSSRAKRVSKLVCQVSPKLFEKKIYLDGNDASSLERPLIGALSVTDNLKNSSRKVTTYFRCGTDS